MLPFEQELRFLSSINQGNRKSRIIYSNHLKLNGFLPYSETAWGLNRITIKRGNIFGILPLFLYHVYIIPAVFHGNDMGRGLIAK